MNRSGVPRSAPAPTLAEPPISPLSTRPESPTETALRFSFSTPPAMSARGSSAGHACGVAPDGAAEFLLWGPISPRAIGDEREPAVESPFKRAIFDPAYTCPVPSGYRRLSFHDMATTVEALVGADKQRFVIHQSFLVEVSPFFRNTFLGDFKEAKEKKIELPVTDPTTFEAFAEWVYTRAVLLSPTIRKQVRANRMRELALLYVFAENYDVPQLERDTMDAIITCVHYDYPMLDCASINDIYDNVPEKSPLCRLMVNEYARKGKVLEGDSDMWPPAFMFAAFNARVQSQQKPLLKPTWDCTYHRHATEVEKCVCMSR